MKKIIIALSLAVSGFSLAQSDNPYVYDQDQTSAMQERDTPAGPGDPGAAPIDEYLPFLFMVAVVLVFTASNKAKSIEKN
ncbi:hypothetical protein QE422_001369 [Chryseobacterium sp. SORGH_AS 447]|uniref:hypothetical protein n=1 Tax=Chryseobacterium sp. SORGH_AS_0447 TaxID=3041769 RepID=UPI00278229A6|nr:hypothetical protein [Chryseobacterium sp. SORGH_AS_0447]MDQ1161001.1 hypothetical protein [Chryseobacterium sp. SORGH_AS_0447]